MDSINAGIHEMDIESALRRVDLNLLPIFDALLRERNVTRAAERVFLSQPAMSNALKRLRETLDDPILVRGARGMQATPRALALEAPVRAILVQIARAVRPAQPFDPATSRMRFVIAMNDYGENVVMPALAARLCQIAPHVELAVHTLGADKLEPLLESGALTLVIGVQEYTDLPARLNSEPWIEERLVCLVSREHASSERLRLTLKRFLQQRHVYPSPLGLTSNIVETWLEKQSLRREIAVTTRSYWAAANVVAHTDYVLSAPRRIAAKLASQLPLRMLEPPAGFPGFRLLLIWHPLYERDPATAWLLEQLRALQL